MYIGLIVIYLILNFIFMKINLFGISNFFLFIYVYRKLVLFIVVIVLFCEVVRIYIMVGFYVIDIYSIVRIWLLYIFVYV